MIKQLIVDGRFDDIKPSSPTECAEKKRKTNKMACLESLKS